MRSCYFNDLLYRIAFVYRVALGAFDVDIDEFQANFKGKSANHISHIRIAANGCRLTGIRRSLPAAAAVISIGASGIWFRLILADVIDPEKTRVSPA
jgi:hypothetical protein